jgi:hypothetical protein
MKTHFILFLLAIGAWVGSANAQPRGGNGFYQDLPANTQNKLDSLRRVHRAEMLALLTPQQRTAFEARRTASRDARQCMRQGNRPQQGQGPRQGRRGN